MMPLTLSSASLLLALVIPMMGAGGELLLQRRSPRWAAPLALATVVASTLALALAWLLRAGSSAGVTLDASGGAFGLALALRLDGLSLPFVANLMGVSLLAVWYARHYMRHAAHLGWFYALLLLFIDAMLEALLADDLLLLVVAWEVMLLVSALLLLRWGEGPNSGAATWRYVAYTQVGSLLLMAAIAWLAHSSGSTRPHEVAAFALTHGRPAITLAAGAMLLGFGVKMAIAPLHGWLPDAHAIAPLPVTVLLAAAMLSLGAYGMLRFVLGMLGTGVIASLQVPLMVLALASQVHGALMSLSSKDIKRIVAYSSVSQMGYVLFGLAALAPSGLTGSVFHIVTHGALKALLFMAVGIVMVSTGRRTVDELGGLGRRLPWLMAALAFGALAMGGLPPLAAFHSEWRILVAGLASRYPLLGAVAFLSPPLTTAYGLLLVARLALLPAPAGLVVRQAPRSMAASTAAAVGLAVAIGVLGGPIGHWLSTTLPLGPGMLP
jgi:proton-translocating NADH-quinone oxidoreductase chain M